MIKLAYNPKNPYGFVDYLRFSSEKQNKRSPDQQFATIQEGITRNGYPWRELRSYRDDGIAGRFIRRRPAFQQMLRDIALGVVQPDLIVVDTMERFGRADEIEGTRRRQKPRARPDIKAPQRSSGDLRRK
jgi:DNA invertase Pin-like site-specific DNA recombinase